MFGGAGGMRMGNQGGGGRSDVCSAGAPWPCRAAVRWRASMGNLVRQVVWRGMRSAGGGCTAGGTWHVLVVVVRNACVLTSLWRVPAWRILAKRFVNGVFISLQNSVLFGRSPLATIVQSLLSTRSSTQRRSRSSYLVGLHAPQEPYPHCARHHRKAPAILLSYFPTSHP